MLQFLKFDDCESADTRPHPAQPLPTTRSAGQLTAAVQSAV
ncbi:hypothetical protein I552_8118 [Mycobacterium xenopi 3993]|nr:hypothetical protein I552_8118 [Mycobacterium xenopi 3993]